MGLVGTVLKTTAKVAGTVVVGGLGIVAKGIEESLGNVASDHSSELKSSGQYDSLNSFRKESSSLSDACFGCVKKIWDGDSDGIADDFEKGRDALTEMSAIYKENHDS